MEDDHTIKLGMEKHSNKAFFGVYDGHNGDLCAHWSAANLWQFIDNLDEHTDSAIQTACLEADKAFLTSDPDSYVSLLSLFWFAFSPIFGGPKIEKFPQKLEKLHAPLSKEKKILLFCAWLWISLYRDKAYGDLLN